MHSPRLVAEPFSPPDHGAKAMRAERGSQKWLQVAVNQSPDMLNHAILDAAGLAPSTSIDWVSPLAVEDYVEYRDRELLDRLRIDLPYRSLASFWPRRGPVWDGLARTAEGELLLVEAKAHIAEMVSPPSRASAASLRMIDKALAETQQALAPRSAVSWSGTFYQLTNRLAHLYLLRALNRQPARMVFLYFVGDREIGGPETRAEWEGAIKVTEIYLGLGRHKLSRFVHHVFVSVKDLQV
jgi:hypothetical protein